MNKPDCNITRKFLKREKGPAEKIRRFLERKNASRKLARKNKTQSKSNNTLTTQDILLPPPPLEIMHKPSEEEIKELTNKSHKRKLERFMGKLNPGKIRENRARYLNGICSDSGVCIAFGPHAKKIKKHFGGFIHFDHVESLKKIGAVSINGFVKEIEYDHDGYKAHAVLKSSAAKNADNLYYEYLVGIFLNAMSNLVPTFLETYGLFKYNSNAEYKDMKKLTATKDKLSGLRLIQKPPADVAAAIATTSSSSLILEKRANELQTACEESIYISILIQHVKDSKTLFEKCNQSNSFIRNELHYVLFQVYWALYLFNSSFTHYDFHSNNVLVYEPVKDGYIHYFYHFQNGSVVSFKSGYIAKIIDYGRCYFNFKMPIETKAKTNIYNDSGLIYDTICKVPKCEPECGTNVGFSTLNSDFYKKYDIQTIKPNISHDLRLLNSLSQISRVKHLNPLIGQFCNKVVYNQMYGTPENTTSGYPANINNVIDAMFGLRNIIEDPSVISDNELEYMHSKKLGEMHIYEDRPLEYIPTV